ncbi:MAG: cytochrome P450 [Sciscionella sp.]
MTTTDQQRLGQLFDPATRPEPYAVYRSLREAGPFPVAEGAVTVVGGYADCARILRDPAMSSDRRRSLVGGKFRSDVGEGTVPFLSLDPPDHTRLRGLVSKAFTPRVVAGLQPRIRAIVTEVLGKAAQSTSFDLVRELAYPLPVLVICELLGVPAQDRYRFEGWSRRLVRGLDPAMAIGSPEEMADIEEARREFTGYFAELISQRRAVRTEDLLSRLVRIEEAGDRLSEQELLATCVLLLVAGHETTANLISNGVLALLRHPEALAALRADPSLVGGVVEEVLRYDSPVHLTTRIVRAPTRIGALEVPTDGVLLLLLAAANRDPAQYREPDRFDIHRGASHHLAFAAGPHFCLGAGLARLEASIALSEFARRVVTPELAPDSLRYRPHVNLRGPERLVVSYSQIT